MKLLLDSFWRAAAYCLHPRVILLSLLPLLVAGALTGLLGYFYWEGALQAVRSTLESWSLVEAVMGWLDAVGATGFRAVIAPLILVALTVPLIVVVSLLLVAVMMTPAIVKLVADRRFAQLERRHGEPLWRSLLWSTFATLTALLALVISIPLWLVPPLVLILPPLIWGWLSYRVMSFDALADHASREERRGVMHEHRWPLLAIGVITGYLGAAPSLVWAVSAAALIFAPLLIVASVWLYTLVFAFASLWFTHYCLAALQTWRATHEPEPAPVPAAPAADPAALEMQAAMPPLPPAL
ncbi:MAG TPA: EI24 domain-containing protein [Methylibium sp.]